MNGDTIYALSTAVGVAAVAVIRVSGPAAGDVLLQLTGRAVLPAARRAVLATLTAPDGAVLDRALCLWFPGPGSFTGEDVAEFHVHGGYGVVSGVMGALGATAGLRSAEAGEFTRRAFDNGRLDLGQVEALSDLVAARTGEQVRAALAAADGTLGRQTLRWRQQLVDVLAGLEAAIDFTDDDVGAPETGALRRQVDNVVAAVEEAVRAAGACETIRRGYTVAILGQPNVGKSSLLNRLSGTEAAIVSEVAGTTRDIVQVELDLDGALVRLCDTAGLRSGAEGIELEGMRRARQVAADADLAIVVHDASRPADIGHDVGLGGPRIDVANKIDLLNGAGSLTAGRLPISVKTGAGVDALVARVRGALVQDDRPREGALVTRRRQRQCLERAVEALSGVDWGQTIEVVAEDLREGVAALDSVVGTLSPEETLDVVFAEFCVGK